LFGEKKKREREIATRENLEDLRMYGIQILIIKLWKQVW